MADVGGYFVGFYPVAKTGQPLPEDMRMVLDGILYRMRSGVQWNYLPRVFGSDPTVHDWFQRFVRDGVFERLWAVLIDACDELREVKWEWQAADGVMNKARFGGSSPAKTRRTGRSRGRSECSWSTGTAARSGAIIAPANAHDSTLIGGRDRGGRLVDRPNPKVVPQNLCLDKGFDTPNARAEVAKAKYVPHIRSIGEENKPCDRAKGHKPRRWVVERAIGWLNKCRAILVRYDKKAENYLGLTQLACALLWWRRLCKISGAPVSG